MQRLPPDNLPLFYYRTPLWKLTICKFSETPFYSAGTLCARLTPQERKCYNMTEITAVREIVPAILFSYGKPMESGGNELILDDMYLCEERRKYYEKRTFDGCLYHRHRYGALRRCRHSHGSVGARCRGLTVPCY